ncbi:MBOAT family O-acyltransferase, partial [Verrucomicrobiota bacterium]
TAFLCMGFAKKILLANSCGKVADMVFDAGGISVLDAWYGAVAYAFQIYFDFSGYSDMAIGLGLMLGFVFAKNFDAPYCSESITDFWRRWHISLSTWLKDYLYIPLGGNRKGKGRTYINLAFVMLLGGLWHGASWNFVIWGGIHGSLLAMERAFGKTSFYNRLPKVFRITATFAVVCVAWVFFRTENLSRAIDYCRALVGFSSVGEGALLARGVIYQPYYLLWMCVAAVIVWFGRQTWDFTRRITVSKAVLLLVLFVISSIVMMTQAFNPFIYFMF